MLYSHCKKGNHIIIIAVSVTAHHVTLVHVQTCIPSPRLPSGTLPGMRTGTCGAKAEEIVAELAQRKLREY